MSLDLLFERLLNYIAGRVAIAADAVSQAKEAATSIESVAETKWDTFGLENSYLAHGQAMRLAECEEDLAYFRKFSFSDSELVETGSILLLSRRDGWRRIIIIADRCGGGEFELEDVKVLIVTPKTPLGMSLLSKEEGDDIPMKNHGVEVEAEIERIFMAQV
ncbi:hypothetical protein [Marinomonas atlantica]|uniref:hypothetical protein n=1 Tax=Marinomonas atlantica TaxID=1806668 RepID=UPI000A5061DA|nr:hypothetical protein [Marinomonas atlantica]MCO4785938.1 hypothetical protein [Marinomonas atlantica]